MYKFCGNEPVRHFDPLGLVVQGAVVCDGHGGFQINLYVPEERDSECTKRHEEQHWLDLLLYYPDACQGREQGSNPVVNDPNFHTFTECNARAEGSDCRKDLLKKCRKNPSMKPDVLEGLEITIGGNLQDDEKYLKTNCDPPPASPPIPQ